MDAVGELFQDVSFHGTIVLGVTSPAAVGHQDPDPLAIPGLTLLRNRIPVPHGRGLSEMFFFLTVSATPLCSRSFHTSGRPISRMCASRQSCDRRRMMWTVSGYASARFKSCRSWRALALTAVVCVLCFSSPVLCQKPTFCKKDTCTRAKRERELESLLHFFEISDARRMIEAVGIRDVADLSYMSAEALRDSKLPIPVKAKFEDLLRHIGARGWSTQTYTPMGLFKRQCAHCGGKKKEHYGKQRFCSAKIAAAKQWEEEAVAKAVRRERAYAQHQKNLPKVLLLWHLDPASKNEIYTKHLKHVGGIQQGYLARLRLEAFPGGGRGGGGRSQEEGGGGTQEERGGLTQDAGSLEGKGEGRESKTDDLNRGAQLSSSTGDLNRRLLAAARNNSIVDVAHILLAGGGGGREGGGGRGGSYTGVIAECEDEKGYTPLHFAAAHGNLGT
jgi:hypothetical protein